MTWSTTCLKLFGVIIPLLDILWMEYILHILAPVRNYWYLWNTINTRSRVGQTIYLPSGFLPATVFSRTWWKIPCRDHTCHTCHMYWVNRSNHTVSYTMVSRGYSIVLEDDCQDSPNEVRWVGTSCALFGGRDYTRGGNSKFVYNAVS